MFQTKLQVIEWTPGRTGEIAPVAIFEPVEIDGCEVSRASLHNLSFIEDLELAPGCRILVSKRNMIIPHVEENLDRGNFSPGCRDPAPVPLLRGADQNPRNQRPRRRQRGTDHQDPVLRQCRLRNPGASSSSCIL